MKISATTFTLSASVLLAALIVVPQLSGSANASTTSDLMKCNYNTRLQTINCCEHILKTNETPQWMQSSGGSCTAAVKCVGGKKQFATLAAKAKPKCYVQIQYEDNQRSPPTGEPRQPRGREQSSNKD